MRIRGRAFIAAAACALAASGCSGGGGDRTPTMPPGGTFPMTATVTMPAFTFLPAQADIAVSGVVSFEFPAEPHNVIFRSGTGKPADIQVTQNVVLARQFNTAGTFSYDCTIHPGMAGTIIVH